MQGFNSVTQSLSATGTTVPIPVLPVWGNVGMLPGILVTLTSGASLTYSVEVTGDDVLASGYQASAGNWVGFSNMTGLTASNAGTLGAVVTAVRLHVTAYTSGTVTLQFVQASAQ